MEFWQSLIEKKVEFGHRNRIVNDVLKLWKLTVNIVNIKCAVIYIFCYTSLKIEQFHCNFIVWLRSTRIFVYEFGKYGEYLYIIIHASNLISHAQNHMRVTHPHTHRVDVVEWSRALDVKLSEWCCSVSMVWVQIPSREEQNFDSSKIYF